jgi:tudor domain-containing protein 2
MIYLKKAFFNKIFLIKFLFCSFWVQLAGPQTTELDFLVDAMTEYYNQKENQELHKIREPYLGQIVAANHLVDSKWYRAEIVAIQPNEITSNELVLDVYFLDYGDQQFVGRKDILELRADFLSLRFQAIECFLAHIQPPQTGSKFEEWDKKSIEKFEDMVQVANWKKLISKVVTYKERKSFALQRRNQRESSPVPGVELYEENSEKSIALELVKGGFAELSDRFGDIAKSSVLIVKEDETKEVPEVKDVINEEISNLKEDGEPQVPEDPVNYETPQKAPSPPPKEEEPPTQPPTLESPQSDLIEVPKEPFIDTTPLPVEQISNGPNNNNFEPSELSNGNSKIVPSSSDAFGTTVKPKKKKKQAVADFLAMEQQQSHQDWNQMMED